MKIKGNFHSLVDQDLVNALSHPLRTYILDALNECEASPSDLAREVGVDVNYVAYHVKELEKIGYVELVRTEPRRGAVEHYYRAKQRFIIEDEEWERLPVAIRQDLNWAIVRSLLTDVKEAVDAGLLARRDGHFSRTRLRVDEKGWKDLNAVMRETLDRVFEIQAECGERLEAADDDGMPVAAAMATFETVPRSARKRDGKGSAG